MVILRRKAAHEHASLATPPSLAPNALLLWLHQSFQEEIVQRKSFLPNENETSLQT